MAKAELTTIEAACDRQHHSLVSCGSICGLFSFVIDDVLSIIHTVFLSRYSRCKTSSWGAGPPNQHVLRPGIARGGSFSRAPPAVTCQPLQKKSKAAACDTYK